MFCVPSSPPKTCQRSAVPFVFVRHRGFPFVGVGGGVAVVSHQLEGGPTGCSRDRQRGKEPKPISWSACGHLGERGGCPAQNYTNDLDGTWAGRGEEREVGSKMVGDGREEGRPGKRMEGWAWVLWPASGAVRQHLAPIRPEAFRPHTSYPRGN